MESSIQYYDNRCKFVAKQKDSGTDPYPKFSVTKNIAEFVESYKSAKEDLKHVVEAIAGRIMNKRGKSKSKLIFYDLCSDGHKIQLMVFADNFELDETEFSNLHDSVKRGDIVGVSGYPGFNKKGELLFCPKTFKVLSPCLHMLPDVRKANANVEKWVPGCSRQPESYSLKDQPVFGTLGMAESVLVSGRSVL
ncbi:lysine--tRNA ligase, cytoplasmic-like [Chenopodium quinoa]|uniref:lysine--tRNA ligase, cytoplasmic-like n=1 Tax=Chenopodium quinoa TaxID=63459 RepID=UPI000B77FFA7|nr:lysine--tRNA ligase, cytoplasmic-like [Chenopodium quinoa]